MASVPGGRYTASKSDTLNVDSATLTKSVTPGTGTIGTPVTYTVDVTIPQQVNLFDTTVVDSLPDDQREVFLLREVANLPFRDIAEITGVGENTVKSRMRYALDRLKDALCDFEEYARALR